MAIYYGIEGIADDKNLLFTAEKAAAAMVNKIKGIDEDGDDIMDIIVDNSDVDKANPNKVSMLKQYTNQVEMLKDNGMDITASQTLMFLRANSFGMMTGILDNRSKPVLQGEVYTGDNGKWLPMPYAYRAHIMTRDVLEIFGFNFQQDENIGFYHKATHCFVVPGWFFDANYANHGGYDLDDTINVMIRKVVGLNGEVKLRAFLLRNPNDFGEWSMIDVSEEEVKHCFHVYTDEIPTINEAELRTRVPQLTDMITNNLINYTYEELPGGSSLRINPVYGIDDERRIRSSIQVLPGGTGQTVLPKMLHYGITGSYVRNQLVSNEQIIDAVQQGVATIRDYQLIAEFCDAVNRSTVNWLRSNNKLVDYYWYATRMSRSPKAYKELGFWGRDFSFINTKENSPIMQLMFKREQIFRAHYAELVRWANNEPKAPEFISNAFTHDEVIAVHKQFDNVRTRYFAAGTTKDWCEDFINIVNRKDATAEGGADETNEMILKLYLYGFIMKSRKPNANYDQWLFSSHKDLDVQPVDIFIRAARALRNNGRRNN